MSSSFKLTKQRLKVEKKVPPERNQTRISGKGHGDHKGELRCVAPDKTPLRAISRITQSKLRVKKIRPSESSPLCEVIFTSRNPQSRPTNSSGMPPFPNNTFHEAISAHHSQPPPKAPPACVSTKLGTETGKTSTAKESGEAQLDAATWEHRVTLHLTNG